MSFFIRTNIEIRKASTPLHTQIY